MEELQETIVEKKKKNRQKSGGEAAASVRAVFYMENKKTLTGCISLPQNEVFNPEEIVKDYQKQLSNIKLEKDSTLAHCAFIACFGNLCVDMQKCIGFEVTFSPGDSAKITAEPLSPAINCLSDSAVKDDAKKDVEKEAESSALKEAEQEIAAAAVPPVQRQGSFVTIPEEKVSRSTENRAKLSEELRTKAYRLKALGIEGKDI